MALTVRALRGLCTTLVEDLAATGRASASTLDAVRPGGTENPGRDTAAWLRYYGQLQFLRGQTAGVSVGQLDGTAAADGVALAAMGAFPRVIPVHEGGEEIGLEVHPKSLEALLRAHVHDLILGKMVGWVEAFRRDDLAASDVELLVDVQDEGAYHMQLLAWIATTPGPGLPFPPGDRRPEVPEAVRAWSVMTLAAVQRAFAQVNWVALRALEHLIAPDPEPGQPPKRPSWSMFVGSLAVESHEDPAALLRNRALVSIVAATQLAAGAKREAMERAKAERTGGGG